MRTQTIVLDNGQEVIINHDSKCVCRRCGKEIFWAMTKNKKAMPIELVSLARWNTHYATCPFAAEFRKKPTKEEQAEMKK